MAVGQDLFKAYINLEKRLCFGFFNLKRGYSPFCASVLLITKVGH